MISNVSVTSGFDYVELRWNIPRYPPERYKVTYLCSINCTWISNCGIDRIVNLTTSNKHVTPKNNFIKLPKPTPKCICTLKLVAVYNPASIDSGIVITYKALAAANTSKFTFVQDFHKHSMCMQLSSGVCYCEILKLFLNGSLIGEIFKIVQCEKN